MRESQRPSYNWQLRPMKALREPRGVLRSGQDTWRSRQELEIRPIGQVLPRNLVVDVAPRLHA